jgi:hypothetical protein
LRGCDADAPGIAGRSGERLLVKTFSHTQVKRYFRSGKAWIVAPGETAVARRPGFPLHSRGTAPTTPLGKTYLYSRIRRGEGIRTEAQEAKATVPVLPFSHFAVFRCCGF